MPTPTISVVGSGPAGAMAALAALEEGANVTVYEKAKFPRHKVCGEFLSNEAIGAARRMGVWPRLEAAGAVRIERMLLQIGRAEVNASLPEPAYGLSRYALDRCLRDEALGRGAKFVQQRVGWPEAPAVVASGRDQLKGSHGPKIKRLFGFKAHFSGPTQDSVELYLFDRCYVGVSPVEGGLTNVCGLAPLEMLGGAKLEPESLMASFEPLKRRLAPLKREWSWLATGPLSFGWRGSEYRSEAIYPAGDALGFIDPFTGAGQAIAMLGGVRAGLAAARGEPLSRYLRDYSRIASRVFGAARLIRWALRIGVAEALCRFVSPHWLFQLTRPRVPAY